MPTATPPPYLGRATKAGIFGVLLMPLGAQSDARRHFLAPFVDFWGPLGGQVAPICEESKQESKRADLGRNWGGQAAPKRAPGSAQERQNAPKGAQSRPKGAQSGPKRHQKRLPKRIFSKTANPCFRATVQRF